MIRLFVKRARLPVLAGGVWLALAGCSDSSESPYAPPALSDGVVFTYPINGQTGVPLGTRFYVTFSKAASQNAVQTACSVDGDGNVSGHFCLLDADDNVVTIDTQVNGKVVQFETTHLRQGTRYRLFVRSAVIGGGDTNLPASDPLLTFTTSQIDPVSGAVPRVTAINGEDPAVYGVGGTPPTARYPFMDFSTLRVEFSEPLDEKTVQAGSSFEFVAVDGVGGETAVPGALIVRKQHVVFDPDEDLTAGVTYRLRLSTAIRDLNGEAVAATSYEMVPVAANACDCVITQHFNTTVAFGEAGFPQTSLITGRPLNAIDLYSPLIGSNDINLRDSTLQAELADPANFGGLVPFVIRKGNFLSITGLDLALGGTVPANLNTGDIKATFLSDVTGFMGRNPYRSADTVPDDDKSPVFVYLIFDLALTGTDDKGNAVLNQTIPHVQATGTARVVNGNLQIETVRTLTMDLLGLDLAPAHMVLGINSDLGASRPDDVESPRITGVYPADGATDFPVRDGLSLIFSEAIDNAGVVANDQIQLFNVTANALVPFQITYDGSTVLLKPTNPLLFGNQYRITLGALTDISANHNALVLDGSDATGGDGVIEFVTENPSNTGNIGPMVTSVHAGAACTLTGSSYASPGRCAGGLGGDNTYLPFNMPADGFLDVQFNQVMNQNTLVLGGSCGSGRVRIERLNDAGTTCTGVVAGTLMPDTRSLRFKPTEPWVDGATYRLTLVGGANATCDAAAEVCGNNNLPLNPDPLNGAQASNAGGNNLVVYFRGAPAAEDQSVYLPLKLEPFTDINGNGFVNGGEVARVQNSAGVALTGVLGGIVSSASLLGDPTLYLSGSLPVTVGLPEPLSVDGTPWGITLEGDSQIPVRVNPGVLYGTSITMDSTATVLGIPIPIADVATGISILRLRETGAPIMGYIVQEAGVEAPQFIAQFDLYMDAPDMRIQVDIPLLGGLIAVNHNLHSLPLTARVKGPITFMPDGRIVIEQANVLPINLTINITSIAGNGSIGLRIPADTMRLRLVGAPLKGRR